MRPCSLGPTSSSRMLLGTRGIFPKFKKERGGRLAPDVRKRFFRVSLSMRLSTRATRRRRRRWSTTCANYGIEIVWYKTVKKYAILFDAVQDVCFCVASTYVRSDQQVGCLASIIETVSCPRVRFLRQLQTCVAGVAPGGRGGGRLIAWGTRLSPLSSWSSICLERGTHAYANVVHGALRRRFTVPVAVSLLRLGAAPLLWGRVSAAGAGTTAALGGHLGASGGNLWPCCRGRCVPLG